MAAWVPTDAIVEAALAHAAEMQPRESCGVVAGGNYIPVDNIMTGFDTFAMDMHRYVEIAKTMKVEAIVHSHPWAAPLPSDADLTMCEVTAKPWMIINWPTGKWTVTNPSGFRAPLVGRTWAWGAHDCWTLVRDAFDDFAGVHLPDYAPPWGFWETGENFMVEHFADAGLVPVEGEWRHCDIAAMQIWPSKVVNHMGLILAPDLLLHQLSGRLSIREVYGGFYSKVTRYHLRHEKFLDQPPPVPEGYFDWRTGK
jgi:proteasome lid subunit RPN8/RPN11